MRWQCYAKCRFTGIFDRLPGQLCRLLDRLSDQLAHHCAQELLLSYNIGVDRDLTRQQLLHRSARSVGLELPEQEQ